MKLEESDPAEKVLCTTPRRNEDGRYTKLGVVLQVREGFRKD